MPGSRCACFAICPLASMALWADVSRDFPPPWAGTPGMHWTLSTQFISQALMIMSTKLKIITWFLEDKFVADRMVGADSEEKARRHAVCSLSPLWHWCFPLSCIQTCICLPMRSMSPMQFASEQWWCISLSTDARLAVSHILLQFLVFEMCFQFLEFLVFLFLVFLVFLEALTCCGIAPSQFNLWLNLVSVKMIAKQEQQCQLNVLFS